jgi:pSer/pThr/pTyr-binding forkhead associated (FHA) protein
VAAYGRLDIYLPNSTIETYALEKPSVGIGRQPGNDLVLDIAGISRYHFVIELRGESVYLIDKESQNGTYIDGERVKSDTPHLLRDGEEIQAGDARIVFHSNVQADIPTLDLQTIKNVQQTFKVEVMDTELTVTPGAHTQTLLKLENVGDSADTYTAELSGLQEGWARLDRVEMDVPPHAMTQALISLKPNRRPDSKPGFYTLTVTVRSHEFPDAKVEVPLKIQVLGYSGFGVVLAQRTISANTPFELYTQNQGSSPLPLTISGRDKSGRLVVTTETPSVTLAAGEKKTIRGTVTPKKKRLFGRPERYPFHVLLQSLDPSKFLIPVSGYYLDKPMLPNWFPIATLIGLFLLLVVILSGGAILSSVFASTVTPTPSATMTPIPPTITPVQVNIPTFTPPVTETHTPSPTFTPEPTATPTDTATASPTATESASATASPTLTLSASATLTRTSVILDTGAGLPAGTPPNESSPVILTATSTATPSTSGGG